MKQYGYQGIVQLGVLFMQLGAVVIIVASTILAAWIMIGAVQLLPTWWNAGCLVLWILVIGWSVGVAMLNVYPVVGVDEQGLVISAFLVSNVRIRWSDILDVGAGRAFPDAILVRARRITPAHIIYGWQFSRSLRPGFLLSRHLQDREELLRVIRQRAPQARFYL